MILKGCPIGYTGESEDKMLKTVFVVYVAGVEKCFAFTKESAEHEIEKLRHGILGMVHVKESFYYKKEVRDIR